MITFNNFGEFKGIEIRKEFTFNNMHIVRNCSSERCKYTAHAHTYHIEVFLTSNKLDNGSMAVDFGLLKDTMKSLIKMFDGAYTLWNKEDYKYKTFVKNNFKKVITVPFSPSAEEYSIFFYKLLNLLIECTQFNNGEGNIKVSKVIVHETHSGYAIANENSLLLKPSEIYTDLINTDVGFNCTGKEIIKTLLNTNFKPFINKKPEQQIEDNIVLY